MPKYLITQTIFDDDRNYYRFFVCKWSRNQAEAIKFCLSLISLPDYTIHIKNIGNITKKQIEDKYKSKLSDYQYNELINKIWKNEKDSEK